MGCTTYAYVLKIIINIRKNKKIMNNPIASKFSTRTTMVQVYFVPLTIICVWSSGTNPMFSTIDLENRVKNDYPSLRSLC